jgi:hypothetical protein
MPWVRLDDTFSDHPKIEKLSDKAFRAYIGGLCLANRYLTDGRLTQLQVRKLANPKARAELLEELWHEQPNGDVEIHDFLDYSRSAEDVKAERKRNADRQKRLRDKRRNEESNGVTPGVTHTATNGVSNAAPSRPVPTYAPNEVLEDCLNPSVVQAEARYEERSAEFAGLDEDKARAVEVLFKTANDADYTSKAIWCGAAKQLPLAALVNAREQLQQRRLRSPSLESESRHITSVLVDQLKARVEA